MGARRPGATAGGATAALALLASCSSPAPTELPASPAMVPVAMSEYRFEHDAAIRAGRAVFQLRNLGRLHHDVVLVRLPEDLEGKLDDQLRSPTRRPLQTVRVLPPVPPGEATAFAADLSSGRYGLICFVTDPDGQTHATKGMSSELVVR